MKASGLKEQLDAARRETDRWPEWKKKEIEAEVRKTPLKNQNLDDPLVAGKGSEFHFATSETINHLPGFELGVGHGVEQMAATPVR